MQMVEDRLLDLVQVDDLAINKATSHLAMAGGKRLRPALCLLAAELGPNPESDQVLDGAVVLEVTHLASLYHDDVMDDAPLRRGVPAAHYLYGNSSAILAGDILLARASKIVARNGAEMMMAHAIMFERLCRGQFYETIGPRDGEDPIEHYLKVLSDKTGSLIAAAGRNGVQDAGGSKELSTALAEYGERVGVAFQLADDVIDLVSDPEITGKTPGTDLVEGVATMPVLLLRRQQTEGTIDTAGAEILRILDQEDLNDNAVLMQAVGMLREHNVLVETRRLAQQWIDDANAQLEPVPDGEVKDALFAFGHAMVDRIA
ncbi:MAG: polyprenyl synthetase family protein [Trueperella sp.]|nr:polyprenyl synthetase family protein [Trueperella sp.]